MGREAGDAAKSAVSQFQHYRKPGMVAHVYNPNTLKFKVIPGYILRLKLV